MNAVPNMLSHFPVADPQVGQNLSVFPLIDDRPAASRNPGYFTLNQGLADGFVQIEEVSRGGSVPELQLKNTADRPVLLLDGEELVGAKQNRVPTVTILAPGGKTIIIPVSCVEAGRWAYRSDRFQTSKRAHFSSGRARKAASVSASLESAGTRYSDQGRVWADIDHMASSLHAPSATRAMADVYDKHDNRIEDYVSGFTAQPGQIGTVFAIGNRIEGAELFDRTATFADLLPKLVRSYALDALDSVGRVYEQPAAADAEAFLIKLKTPDWKRYDAVGMGIEVRLNTDEVLASGLVHEDEIVHLVAFRSPDDDAATNDTGLSRSRARRGLMGWRR